MWIYLGALLVVLAPLLSGANALKKRLEIADRSARARLSEGTLASGQRTMQQITDAHVDIATYLLVVALAFLYPIGVMRLELLLTGGEGNIIIPLGFAAVVLLWSAHRLHERLRAVAQLRTSLVANLEVGHHVDALMRQGYYVFHDVPADGFDLEHVAVGRNGVFVISVGTREPKGTGAGRLVEFEGGELRYPKATDTEAIVAVRGKAIWLATWLSHQLGRRCHTTPVLCLPGWHVELKTTPTFPILNQKYLGWTLPGWQGETLDEAQLQQICTLLDALCREDAPPPLAEAA